MIRRGSSQKARQVKKEERERERRKIVFIDYSAGGQTREGAPTFAGVPGTSGAALLPRVLRCYNHHHRRRPFIRVCVGRGGGGGLVK